MPTQPPEPREVLRPRLETTPEQAAQNSTGADKRVHELTPAMGGCWLVVTRGSVHEWDLDAMTYTRIPGSSSGSGSFDYDLQSMAITRVQRWPQVGSTSLVFYDDPSFPEGLEQWRQSSPIASITRIPDNASIRPGSPGAAAS